ncbi:A24 family peptidase [Paenarthrobacter sp. DKR-5]|uniref:prepilin peptidase n=1 Tax=Paenarthrobacter sp. DKR-5 TaxID=2835535 RepID=UPI001BDBB254|nr:A24 family peptidase [Paenarthrobacter sp. DKR-5]MBT1001042.1 A24 family peptidase [Paenarthrobacter sp. DKR-5]
MEPFGLAVTCVVAAVAALAAALSAEVLVPRYAPAVPYAAGRALQWTTAAAAAVLAALLALRTGPTPALAAYVVLATGTAVLSRIDLHSKLLPNRISGFVFIAGLVLFSFAAILRGELSNLIRALAGASLLLILYVILRLISPRSIGMGDVKLAPTVGLYSGYLGWNALGLAVLLGFLAGGAVSLALVLAGKAGRKAKVPFGPSMLAGTVLAILLG